jgi:hypothetical protein
LIDAITIPSLVQANTAWVVSNVMAVPAGMKVFTTTVTPKMDSTYPDDGSGDSMYESKVVLAFRIAFQVVGCMATRSAVANAGPIRKSLKLFWIASMGVSVPSGASTGLRC